MAKTKKSHSKKIHKNNKKYLMDGTLRADAPEFLPPQVRGIINDIEAEMANDRQPLVQRLFNERRLVPRRPDGEWRWYVDGHTIPQNTLSQEHRGDTFNNILWTQWRRRPRVILTNALYELSPISPYSQIFGGTLSGRDAHHGSNPLSDSENNVVTNPPVIDRITRRGIQRSAPSQDSEQSLNEFIADLQRPQASQTIEEILPQIDEWVAARQPAFRGVRSPNLVTPILRVPLDGLAPIRFSMPGEYVGTRVQRELDYSFIYINMGISNELAQEISEFLRHPRSEFPSSNRPRNMMILTLEEEFEDDINILISANHNFTPQMYISIYRYINSALPGLVPGSWDQTFHQLVQTMVGQSTHGTINDFRAICLQMISQAREAQYSPLHPPGSAAFLPRQRELL